MFLQFGLKSRSIDFIIISSDAKIQSMFEFSLKLHWKKFHGKITCRFCISLKGEKNYADH